MTLLQYVPILDLRAVGKYLAAMVRLLGLALLLPLLDALWNREFFYAGVFAVLSGGTWLVGWAGSRLRAPDLEFREALVVTALAYLVFGGVGALAFLPVASFLDGFFEMMSGFTTTGLSVFVPEHLPQSLLFLRAYSQWVGGAGIVVLSVAVLIGPGKTAMQLFSSESGGENLVGSVMKTGRVVLRIYVVLTLLGFLALWAAGMPPHDALLHVMATLSTGGFSSHGQSVAYFASTGGGGMIVSAVIVFMCLGATSFPLFYMLRKEGPQRLWRDPQVQGFVVLVLGATIFFAFFSGGRWTSMRTELFQAVTCLTTTGFSLDDPGTWTDRAKFMAVILMIIGGMTGSTAGGLKILRLLYLAKLAGWMVTRAVLPPEAKVAIKYRGNPIPEGELRGVAGLAIIYGAIWAAGALVLTGAGFPLGNALFESASALGTVGLSSGITSAGLAWGYKLLLIMEMWLGRLEILPVLVLIYPGFWRVGRRAL